MNETLKKLSKDFGSLLLPSDTRNLDKLKVECETGKRVHWYYEEDGVFFTQMGENVKSHLNDIYSGILIPIPGWENNHGSFGVEDCVVIIDQYPCEMSYPEVDWVSMGRLLDDNTLVEVF